MMVPPLKQVLTILPLFLGLFTEAGASELTLQEALGTALQGNPALQATKEKSDAESSLIRSQAFLENPRIGVMQEKNMYLMQDATGPMLGTMRLWSVTQDIRFPTKYFLQGAAQSARADAAASEYQGKRWEVRRQVFTAYFNLFSIRRIISLLEAQKETLREVARSAESRRATGAVPQQDEMKAHVEQTRIEAEILSAEQEADTAEAELNARLGRAAITPIKLPEGELKPPRPRAVFTTLQEDAGKNSKRIEVASFQALAANREKHLAGWEFAPDFSLTYRRAFSGPQKSAQAIGLEVSFPLWFAMKQTAEYSAAASRSAAAEREHEAVRIEVQSQVRSLAAKVTSQEKLLKIYETSLIPQATSTLNSSRSAYSAGRTTFLELLDSERSLYQIRIGYYRQLTQYVESLAQLEEIVGTVLCDLPGGL